MSAGSRSAFYLLLGEGPVIASTGPFFILSLIVPEGVEMTKKAEEIVGGKR